MTKRLVRKTLGNEGNVTDSKKSQFTMQRGVQAMHSDWYITLIGCSP